MEISDTTTIAEISDSASGLGNEDLLLVSTKDGSTYKSSKLTGQVLTSHIDGRVDSKVDPVNDRVTILEPKVSNLEDDANLLKTTTVKTSGDQTVGGTKTFSARPVLDGDQINNGPLTKAEIEALLAGYTPSGGGSGVVAFDLLYKSDGSAGSRLGNAISFTKNRKDYTSLVFVFKNGTKYKTSVKTNNEIEAVLNASGSLLLEELNAPVVGNGKLGIADLGAVTNAESGSVNGLFINNGSGASVIDMVSENLASSNQHLFGVSNNPASSGLEAKLDQSTGLEITGAEARNVTLTDATIVDAIYGMSLSGSDAVGVGGGVIDGSIWKKADGTPEITYLAASSSAKEYVYTVKNDCMLYIASRNVDITGANATTYVCVLVNGQEVARIGDMANGASGDCLDARIPVSRGSVVKVTTATGYVYGDTAVTPTNNSGTFETVYGTTAPTSYFSFTEFKLNSLNPQIAMPDWDESKKKPVTLGSALESDGFLQICPVSSMTKDVNYPSVVYVNGINVWMSHYYQDDPGRLYKQTSVVPVSKGDIVTTTGAENWIVSFYPVKMHEIRTTSASAIEVIAMSSRSDAPSWWKVYSNGWCEQGGQATPTYQTGSTVHIPIQMNDTSYNCSCVCSGANNDWGNVANEDIDARTVNSISISCNDTASSPSHPNNKVFWEIKGWISDATLLAIKNGTYTFPGQS